MPQTWTMHHHGKPPQTLSGCGTTGYADSTPRRETSRPERANHAEEAQAQTVERASAKPEVITQSSRRFIYGGRVKKVRGSGTESRSVLQVLKKVS
jgi:hypothetical protein